MIISMPHASRVLACVLLIVALSALAGRDGRLRAAVASGERAQGHDEEHAGEDTGRAGHRNDHIGARGSGPVVLRGNRGRSERLVASGYHQLRARNPESRAPI